MRMVDEKKANSLGTSSLIRSANRQCARGNLAPLVKVVATVRTNTLPSRHANRHPRNGQCSLYTIL